MSEAKPGHLDAVWKEQAHRQRGYRERALARFPHVCASCGREFSGRRLKELTIHHKDHNHDNNPPDGSNWELLCVYCHDAEHEKHLMRGHGGGATDLTFTPSALFNPFDRLEGVVPEAGRAGSDARPEPGEEPPAGKRT
jgi:hypothetical protein